MCPKDLENPKIRKIFKLYFGNEKNSVHTISYILFQEIKTHFFHFKLIENIKRL